MIEFNPPLIEGLFVRRYKRFFADIEVAGIGQVTAHCANTGRMTGLLIPGSRVWIRPQPPGRKLLYAWELIEIDSHLVCVNTARANQLMASTALSEWLPGAELIRREPRVGAHRFDLECSRVGAPVYVEIKSVTLWEGGEGWFPDAPSKRANSHVRLLSEMARKGVEARLLMVSMHSGIQSIRPSVHIDPEFEEVCHDAINAGVIIEATAARITLDTIRFGEFLPCII